MIGATRRTNRWTRGAIACFSRSFIDSKLSLARSRVNSTVRPQLLEEPVSERTETLCSGELYEAQIDPAAVAANHRIAGPCPGGTITDQNLAVGYQARKRD